MNPQEDDVDSIVLCGKRSPGKAIVEGAGQPRKWDETPGIGMSGSTLSGGGLGLSEFTVRIQLWEPEHFVEWSTWRDLLKPPKPAAAGFTNGIAGGTKIKALDIRNPLLDEVDVNAVVVVDRTQLTQVEDTGIWECTITFKAYRAPKPVLAKPDGVASNPPGQEEKPFWKDAGDAEMTANNAKLEAKWNELANTKWGGEDGSGIF